MKFVCEVAGGAIPGVWRCLCVFQRLSWRSPLVRCSPSVSALHKSQCVPRLNPTGGGNISISGDLGSPLPCPECGREFHGLNKKFLLTRHMITHTGEKPYQCPHCPYRANVSSNLTRHLRTVHTPTTNLVSAPSLLSASVNLATSSSQTVHHPSSPLWMKKKTSFFYYNLRNLIALRLLGIVMQNCDIQLIPPVMYTTRFFSRTLTETKMDVFFSVADLHCIFKAFMCFLSAVSSCPLKNTTWCNMKRTALYMNVWIWREHVCLHSCVGCVKDLSTKDKSTSQIWKDFQGIKSQPWYTVFLQQGGAFVKSQRGKNLLYFEGFKHRICREEVGGRTSWWRCTKKTCRGRARLSVEGITMVVLHNHDPHILQPHTYYLDNFAQEISQWSLQDI